MKDLILKEIEKQKEKKLEKIKIIIDQVESLKNSIYINKHDVSSIYVNVDLYNTLYEIEMIKQIDDLIEQLKKESEKEEI